MSLALLIPTSGSGWLSEFSDTIKTRDPEAYSLSDYNCFVRFLGFVGHLSGVVRVFLFVPPSALFVLQSVLPLPDFYQVVGACGEVQVCVILCLRHCGDPVLTWVSPSAFVCFSGAEMPFTRRHFPFGGCCCGRLVEHVARPWGAQLGWTRAANC